jgi:DNA-directed RNA polymerase specialized sigma24 family protein
LDYLFIATPKPLANPTLHRHPESSANLEKSFRAPVVVQTAVVGAPTRSAEATQRLAHASAPAPIEVLLRRMQAGDRAAAAEFLLRFETRIRRRVRSKLGSDVRRLFDSLDILSTLGRRLDGYVLSGRLRAESEVECLGLLFRIADNALIDKTRLVRRLETLEGEDGEFAQGLAARLRHIERQNSAGMHLEIEKCMRALPDAIDRRILSLWLTGEQPKDIAMLIRVPATAVRKRWQHIKETLRDRFPVTAN